MTTDPTNPANRLDSWKEIAAYLRRDVRTVQRWETKENLPIHRHLHDKLGSIYAYKPELDAWLGTRRQEPAAPPPLTAQGALPPEKIKLAILPFENLNSDPEEDYFSDGLTEEMITQMTRLQPARLAVIALSTALRYKASGKPLEQIKAELEADYLLQGRVRRAAGRVRITAQLVALSDQTQLWAESYERDLGDILAVQAGIAQAIAREVQVIVSRPEQARFTDMEKGRRRINPAAYESYLKARYYLHDRPAAMMSKSLECFEDAIRQDPNYAPSYAGLASAYGLLSIAPFDLFPPREAMPKAERAALRSLELDDSLAEAHTALALVRHHYNWEWDKAEAGYQRAIELNPDYANAHLWYSWMLLALGRREEAFEEIDLTLALAQQTDPHRLVAVQATRAMAYYFGRDYERAVQECKKAMEMSPGYFMLHFILGRAYARLGMNAEAIAQLKPEGYRLGEIPLLDAALGLAHSMLGHTQQTEKMVEAFHAHAQRRYIPATYFGMLHAGLGDKDQALAWLEKAYEERADGLTWLNVEPMLDEVRSDPRFRNLIQRIGLEP